MDLFGEINSPSKHFFEDLSRRQGFRAVAGVDEAGRGALAGPVVAAAVMLPAGLEIPGLDDSKKLTASKRDELYGVIRENALSIGVGFGDHELIDRINILQATLFAMKQAVQALSPPPECLLIDGISKIQTHIHQRTIKKGDSASASIAAASIIAKVTRDRFMVEADSLYPGYGFLEHKGYGCKAHMDIIAKLGPCVIHRTTFRGVREHLQVTNSDR